MKNKTCCFTGHRIIPSHAYENLRETVTSQVLQCIAQGYCYFATGGALGFDTLVAQVILELRESYSHIKLILVLPCVAQTKYWKKEDIEVYESVKQRCNQVIYCGQQYTTGCMQKRNRYLIDHSGLCVAYCTKDTGGTAFTVGYAKTQGVAVIHCGKAVSLM